MIYAVGKPGPGLGWIGTQCGGVKPVNGIATPPFDNLISNANTYVNKRKKPLLSCLNMYVIPTEIYEYMKVNSATQILVINCAVNSGNDNTYIW
jgi:hypothetical protein